MQAKSILIIEGNEIKRRILKDFFWFCGYDACVDDMSETISLLESKAFSLVLVDCCLPDIASFIGMIRSTYPSIPVIGMCSAEETLIDGINDAYIKMVISRPFDLRELMDAVGLVLNIPRPHP